MYTWPFTKYTSSQERTTPKMTDIDSAKYRLVSWLTLIPTFFTFIAIILINVGGVSPSSSYSWYALTPERNTAYNLVNWNYTVSPASDATSYGYHLYLNRLCGLTEVGGAVTSTCRNNRINGWIYSGIWLWQPASWLPIWPFRFNNIDLNAPFAFYLLAAIWCVVMMVPGIAGARHFSSRMAALVNSAITFLWILVASACITGQMETLKRQLRNNTITSSTINMNGSQVTMNINVASISVGQVVLGLTWAATGAMLLETIMWGVAVGNADDAENQAADLEKKSQVQVRDTEMHGTNGGVVNGDAAPATTTPATTTPAVV